MADASRTAIVEELFRAWSSGDADAPRDLLTADAVLDDVIGGLHVGWPAIRAYFARGLEHWPDLTLVPTGDYWERPDGLALTWVMSATAPDDRFGPGTAGRRWQAPGMSFVVFDGDRVAREVDYHDGGSRGRSLQQEAP
jgi:ketosteroid isomerase-like protein